MELNTITMHKQQLRLFLADDHPTFREGIKALLEKDATMKVVGEASDGGELLQKLGLTQAQVLLLDIDMPVISGLEVITALRDQFPLVHILVFSMHSNEEYIHQMLSKGAKGYILKSCKMEELIRAIITVSSGDTYLSEEASKKLITYVSTNKQKQKETPLTKREIEVIKLVSLGLTNVKIGEQLSISHRTVDTHRRNIMEKLDLHNAAALTNYAAKNGLLPQ